MQPLSALPFGSQSEQRQTRLKAMRYTVRAEQAQENNNRGARSRRTMLPGQVVAALVGGHGKTVRKVFKAIQIVGGAEFVYVRQ